MNHCAWAVRGCGEGFEGRRVGGRGAEAGVFQAAYQTMEMRLKNYGRLT